jgi:hypothetical protein
MMMQCSITLVGLAFSSTLTLPCPRRACAAEPFDREEVDADQIALHQFADCTIPGLFLSG